jgi:hypothetical protein
LGATNNTNQSSNKEGYVKIFKFINNNWELLGQQIEGVNYGDKFGSSIDLNNIGNRIIIGAMNYTGLADEQQKGQAQIYEYNDTLNEWVQLGQDINGDSKYDFLGKSVSMNSSGNIIAVSAPYIENGSPGYVRIYKYNSILNEWVQLGNTINGQNNDDKFGWTISINNDGNRIAIIAPYANNVKGSVQVYELNGTNWTQMGNTIYGENSNDGDFLSQLSYMHTVQLNGIGNRFIMGSPAHNSYNGHARIFEWNGTAWNQIGQNINSINNGDQFGNGVSINNTGSRVAIGAIGSDPNDSNSGQVRIFQYNSEQKWEQIGIINGINANVGSSQLGYSVKLNDQGCRVIVGANSSYITGKRAGYAEVYELDCSPQTTKIVTENIYDYYQYLIKYYTQLLATACACGEQPKSIEIRNTCINTGIIYNPPQVDDNINWCQNTKDQWIKLQCIIRKKLSCILDILRRIESA